MDITYRTDKDILYIAVEGRIDASNAAEAEEKIFDIKNNNPGKHIVLDADKLPSVYMLSRQEKQRIAEHLYRTLHLPEDQIRRCLYL